jgi:hypothetical protein
VPIDGQSRHAPARVIRTPRIVKTEVVAVNRADRFPVHEAAPAYVIGARLRSRCLAWTEGRAPSVAVVFVAPDRLSPSFHFEVLTFTFMSALRN